MLYAPLKQLPMHISDQTHKVLPSTQTAQIIQSHVSRRRCDYAAHIWWSPHLVKSTFEMSCTVGAQPKFALVDMFSHASCKNRQNVGNQSAFPTI